MLLIFPGQQDLGHGVVILGEQLVVGVHQLALAHGGGGLLTGHVGGLAGQVQLAHAHADGAGGHQDHLVSGVLQVGQDLHQILHVADIHMAGSMGQSGSTNFNNDAHIQFPPYFFARERVFS